MTWWKGSIGLGLALAVACSGSSHGDGPNGAGGIGGKGGKGGRGGSGQEGGEAGNAEGGTGQAGDAQAGGDSGGSGGSSGGKAGAGSGGTSGGKGGSSGAAGAGGRGGRGGSSGAAGTSGTAGSGGKAPKPPPGELAFAEDQVLEIRLVLDDGDWNLLEEEGDKEEFVPASVSMKGEGFPDASFASVGLRHKGAWSLHHCWDDFAGVRSYENECRKLSYKIKFDEYDKDGRFDGLKRLNLHASSNDQTKIRELLAYSTFADFGLVAPRTAPARVFINGELQGLFIAVEEIDGRFAKAHYPDGADGNLFKEIWPRTEAADADFLGALETNEEAADVSDMRAFADAVVATNNTDFITDMTPWVEVDSILRYMAVDRALKNWDGITAFYSPLTSHNFFWYHDNGTDDLFHLIPWDLDNTFWDFDPYMYPEQWVTAEPVPDWNSEPADCTPRPVWDPAGSTKITPPRCDPFLDMLAETSWSRFVDFGDQLLAGPLKASTLSAKVAYRRTQIAPLVAEDPTMDADLWSAAVDGFAATLTRARTDFQSFLDAGLISEPPRPVDPTQDELDAETLDTGLHVVGMTNFEFAAPPMTTEPAAIFTYGDTLTTYLASWNTTAPLSGNADLLLDFTFNEQPGAYDEYVGMGIVTQAAEVDISALSRIVMTLSTDAPRNVRIRAQSPVYDDTWGGIWSEFGVDLWIDGPAQVVSIQLDSLVYPEWARAAWTDMQGFSTSDGEARLMVLQRFNGLVFAPAATVDVNGDLVTDPEPGFLHVDNIYFR